MIKLNFRGSSKRANVAIEGITIMVVLLVFAFLVISMYMIKYEVNADIQNDSNMSDYPKLMSQQGTDDYPRLWDNMFIMVLVGLWLGALIAAWFIDTSPIFLIIAVFLIIFVLILAAIVSNVYEEWADDPDIQEYADAFPIINWVMQRLVLIVMAITFSVAVALYGKTILR